MDTKLEKHWNWQGGKSYKKYKCKVCGKVFITKECYEKRGGNKACSRKCYYKSQIGKIPSNKGKDGKPNYLARKRTKFICKQCGKEFEWPLWKAKKRLFCSRKCRAENGNKKVDNKCPICGKEFKSFPSQKRVCCSRKCAFISAGRKRIGKNNGNWIDGRTPDIRIIRNSKKLKEWKMAVFARDNFTCQKCGQRGHKLHSHHIQNFGEWEELRFEVSNGITFCEKCHKKFHILYGIKHNNYKQIKEFLCFQNPIYKKEEGLKI